MTIPKGFIVLHWKGDPVRVNVEKIIEYRASTRGYTSLTLNGEDYAYDETPEQIDALIMEASK